jgi:transposase InsO family protein
MKNRTTEEVFNRVKIYCEEIGKPKKLISDNALEFTSDKLKKFCMHEKIGQHFSTPYKYTSKGRVERFIRTLRLIVSKLEGSIEKRVKKAKEKYNASWHSSIKDTPWNIFNKQSLVKGEDKCKMKERREVSEFKAGDEVYIEKPDYNKGRCEPKFVGPGCVVESLGNDTYDIEYQGKFRKHHIDQLKTAVAAV